jgi:ATP/maltotriose-dependent transcriptional regulator MalT
VRLGEWEPGLPRRWAKQLHPVAGGDLPLSGELGGVGREQQVVTLVARGASTARIAATLHVSEYTVQNRRSHVLEKVGVRDRRALVRRLFLDVLYPSLFG